MSIVANTSQFVNSNDNQERPLSLIEDDNLSEEALAEVANGKGDDEDE